MLLKNLTVDVLFLYYNFVDLESNINIHENNEIVSIVVSYAERSEAKNFFQ